MSNSVRPHRRQPTRLPHPWGSPGKNTGVGCHFLLQCMKVKSESEVAQSCPTLSDSMGFSRQEYWRGLPLPSPNEKHTTEKKCLVTHSVLKQTKHGVHVCACVLRHVQLFTIPWTAAYQAPPSMGFSRQEYWIGVPLPSPAVGYLFDFFIVS